MAAVSEARSQESVTKSDQHIFMSLQDTTEVGRKCVCVVVCVVMRSVYGGVVVYVRGVVVCCLVWRAVYGCLVCCVSWLQCCVLRLWRV